MSGDTETTDTARHHLAWLAHPITLVALVLLLVNDHVLKAAYPGVVTGKLSDVAGLVLAPPLLATLVSLLAARSRAEPVAAGAVVAVGAAFALVKAVPDAAAVTSAAWSVVQEPSLVRADRTDLLALPALGLAWLTWTRARRRPAPGRVARAVRLGIVLPVALAGVAATSVSEYTVSYAVGAVPGLDGGSAMLVARFDDSHGRRYEIVLVSRDGRSWHRADDSALAPVVRPATASPERTGVARVTRTTIEPVPEEDAAVEAAVEAAQVHRPVDCAPGRTRCWRSVPGELTIEESMDGGATWTTAWSVGESTRERYLTVVEEEADEVEGYPIEDLDQEMSCTNVYVVPGSGVVVVACGLAGFVSRDTAGEWMMLGFDGSGLESRFDEETPDDM